MAAARSSFRCAALFRTGLSTIRGLGLGVVGSGLNMLSLIPVCKSFAYSFEGRKGDILQDEKRKNDCEFDGTCYFLHPKCICLHIC